MEYREATPRDVEAIAELHAESWRRNYRGTYLDSYLDGDVVADRLTVWTDRLTSTRPNQRTIVAEQDDRVVGFAHTIFDDDPRWGALLDNLHVVHDRKRHGIGTRLMEDAARAVLTRRPPTGLYLWVLEQNTAAQAFYAAQGGREVGRNVNDPLPGGGTAVALRYAWPDPSVLAEIRAAGLG